MPSPGLLESRFFRFLRFRGFLEEKNVNLNKLLSRSHRGPPQDSCKLVCLIVSGFSKDFMFGELNVNQIGQKQVGITIVVDELDVNQMGQKQIGIIIVGDEVDVKSSKCRFWGV